MEQGRPIIYLYTDTRWQNINMVPALHLGRIDKLVILTARRGGDFKQVDEANAVRTHHGFISGYEHELGRRGVNATVAAVVLEGPLVGLRGWRDAVLEEMLEAPQHSTIVFNYLSGPTDVKIGAWLALDDLRTKRPDITVRRVLYDAPSRLEWHEDDGREWMETANHLLSLEGWLCLHRFTEPPEKRRLRQERERAAQSFAESTRRLAKLTFRFPGMPAGWFTQISGILKPGITCDLVASAECDRVIGTVSKDVRLRALGKLDAIVRFAGKRFSHPFSELRSFNVTDGLFDYLRGGWFEELIYLTILERLKSRNLSHGNTEVALGVHLHPFESTPAGDVTQPNTAHDIDVAVIARNQLHAIECKAYKHGIRSTNRQNWVDRARTVREAGIGPGGVSLLVSAVEMSDEAGTRAWAKLGQVDFAAGWPEISQKLDDLIRRCT